MFRTQILVRNAGVEQAPEIGRADERRPPIGPAVVAPQDGGLAAPVAGGAAPDAGRGRGRGRGRPRIPRRAVGRPSRRTREGSCIFAN